MIVRPDYIRAITPFIDQPLVKILAGVRRCGKSTIFEMIAEELQSRGIPKDHIILKRYTEMDIPENISAIDMYRELLGRMQGKGRCYLLLDEIQEVKGWERWVNSLLEGQNADIYVTGSNSKLMSSELSTYLTRPPTGPGAPPGGRAPPGASSLHSPGRRSAGPPGRRTGRR